MTKLKILFIAGEASGDILGGKLIAALKNQTDAKLELMGIGGTNMEKHGLHSLFSISELSLMGFTEIVPHIPRLLKRINQTAKFIIDQKPDIVITIDSPDFCFRVMKKVNQSEISEKIKKIHFIAPTVWAYRPGRTKKIAKLYDLLLVILPFEPPYFEKYGLKTVFIGHPIIEKNPDAVPTDFRIKYGISKNEILICLTPGSRIGEIKRILPEMTSAINILSEKYSGITAVILATDKTYDLIRNHLGEFKTKVILTTEQDKVSAFNSANLALAKSGTNTLEISLHRLPMIVTYKTGFLTYLIIRILVKVKFANLINIISNREIIPEMLQFNCQKNKLAAKLEELILNPDLCKKQIEESKMALKMLGIDAKETPSNKAAKAVLNLIS